ncbi:CBY1-interacting BAR domain-containing protein 1-like [Biomphalaria glabrata]|uniref:CBY1-interacting BAR domain-containing protein 1-like n=1 Tax=Biomphalaria glabrata TaxID=6526 RepID=A0A9W3AVX0_BIOGL|nr:CBY1-interacting BAR domain-containing protein 1-like [Biomphalaria glabrata]
MSRTGAEIHRRLGHGEKQSKVIQDRISHIEQHLSQLCSLASSYTRKTAKLRDKGDLIAKEFLEFSEYEKWNPSLSAGMAKFAENVSAVQDYREAEIKRLEVKIISPLVHYGLLCKQTKNDLKSAFSAIDAEVTQKKKLETIKSKNPGDRLKILMSESTLQRVSLEATRSSKALEQQVDKFEEKKLKDLKKIMREFATIEMHFHAKALEIYTQTCQALESIDPDADLEEFRHQLRPNGSIRSDIARSASQASLDSRRSSLGNTTPTKPSSIQDTPTNNKKKIPVPQPQDLEDDSEEDDDDDDDESEEDDSDEEESEEESEVAPKLPPKKR